LFDKFLVENILTETYDLISEKYLSYAAACAVIISSKYHDSKARFTISSFPCIQTNDLIEFERFFLKKINYDIDPEQTSVFYIRQMLYIWPNSYELHNLLFQKATTLLASFQETYESTAYSSFIIAISLLLIAFSKLNIDSTDWLSCLPKCCSQNSSDISESNFSTFQNIQSCKKCILKLESAFAIFFDKKQCDSPTAVSDILTKGSHACISARTESKSKFIPIENNSIYSIEECIEITQPNFTRDISNAIENI